MPPTIPVLLQILSGTQNASNLLPSGSIYGLAANKSVEISIPGGAVGGPVSISSNNHDAVVLTTSPAPHSLTWAHLLRSSQRWEFDLQLQ